MTCCLPQRSGRAFPLIAIPKVVLRPRLRQGRQERTARSKGVVRQIDARAIALCAECPERPTITYDAEAGVGFSGGPVVEVISGAVVAITVGYLDGAAENGGRRMYAVDMDFVMAEMRRLMPDGIAGPGR